MTDDLSPSPVFPLGQSPQEQPQPLFPLLFRRPTPTAPPPPPSVPLMSPSARVPRNNMPLPTAPVDTGGNDQVSPSATPSIPQTPSTTPLPSRRTAQTPDEIAVQNATIAQQLRSLSPQPAGTSDQTGAFRKIIEKVHKEAANDAHAQELGIDKSHPEKQGKKEDDTYARLSSLPKLDPSANGFAKQYDRLGKYDLYQVVRRDDNGDAVPTGVWRRKMSDSADGAAKDPDVTSGFGVGKVINAAGNTLAADADSLKANILRAAGHDREARQAATIAEERSNVGMHQSAIGSFLGQAAPIIASQVAAAAAAPETAGASEAAAVAEDIGLLGRLFRGASPALRAAASAPGMGVEAGLQSANRTAARDEILGRSVGHTLRDAAVGGGVDAALNSIAPELGGRLYATLRPGARGTLAEARGLAQGVADGGLADRLGGRLAKDDQAVARSVREDAAREADAAAARDNLDQAARQRVFEEARRRLIRERGSDILGRIRQANMGEAADTFAQPALDAATDAAPLRAGRFGSAVGTAGVFGAGSAVGDEIKHLNDPETNAGPTPSSVALQAGLGGLFGALHGGGLKPAERQKIVQQAEDALRSRRADLPPRSEYDPEGAAAQQARQTEQAATAAANRDAFFGQQNPFRGEAWTPPSAEQTGSSMSADALREQYARADAHVKDASKALSIMDKIPSRTTDEQGRYVFAPELHERGIGETTRKFEGMTPEEIRQQKEQAQMARADLSHALSVHDTPEGIRQAVNDVQAASASHAPDAWMAEGPAGPDMARRYAEATRDAAVLERTIDVLRRNPTAFADHDGRFQAHEFFGDSSIADGHIANQIDGMTRREMEDELHRRQAEMDSIRHQAVRYQEAYDGLDTYDGGNRYLDREPFDPTGQRDLFGPPTETGGEGAPDALRRESLNRDLENALREEARGLPVPSRVRNRIISRVEGDAAYDGMPEGNNASLVRQHAREALAEYRRERSAGRTPEEAETDAQARASADAEADRTLTDDPSQDQLSAIAANGAVSPHVRAQAIRQHVAKRVADLTRTPEQVQQLMQKASRLTKSEYAELTRLDTNSDYDVHNNTVEELAAAEVLRRAGGENPEAFVQGLRDDARVKDC